MEPLTSPLKKAWSADELNTPSLIPPQHAEIRDISLLWRISCILHHDFFGDLSQEMKCDVNFSLPFSSGTE